MFKNGDVVCLKNDYSVKGVVVGANPSWCEVRFYEEEKTALCRTGDLVSYADVLFNHAVLYDNGN